MEGSPHTLIPDGFTRNIRNVGDTIITGSRFAITDASPFVATLLPPTARNTISAVLGIHELILLLADWGAPRRISWI